MRCVGLRVFIILLIASLAGFAEKDVKIKNLDDLTALAKQGDSNALCLLGMQEFLGGQIYDPRIIETVTVEQILLSKQEEWRRRIAMLPKNEDSDVIQSGEKIRTMVRYFKKAAELDNKIALYCYGVLLENGIGVEKNDEESLQYYLKSAEMGFPPAFSAVGSCYNSGSGTPLDEKKAIDWFLKGIKAGDIDSKVKIGQAYLNGWEVEKDPQKGFKLIEEASASGSSFADSELGACYLYGLGAKQDFGKAFAILKNASQINSTAKTDLGLMYLKGQGTLKDEKKGVRLIEDAAETGDSYAEYSLGCIYWVGEGVPVNLKKAKDLFEKSAKKNYSRSMVELYKIYHFGTGDVEIDKKVADEWLKKAQELKDEEAERILNEKYEGKITKTSKKLFEEAWDDLYGTVSKADKINAIKKLEKLRKEGYVNAIYILGLEYESGKNIEQNYAKARDLYFEVLEFKEEDHKKTRAWALKEIGELYYHGQAFEKDYQKAFEYFQKAELEGCKEARANLGLCYYRGYGIEQNHAKALEYFLSIVDGLQDDESKLKGVIMTNIGCLLFNFKRDRIEGNKWFSRAIALKNPSPDAYFQLGLSYYKGEGVDQNKEKGMELFKEGAKKNDVNSKNVLAKIEKGQEIP